MTELNKSYNFIFRKDDVSFWGSPRWSAFVQLTTLGFRFDVRCDDKGPYLFFSNVSGLDFVKAVWDQGNKTAVEAEKAWNDVLDFACKDEEEKTERPMNNVEKFEARKALCSAIAYLTTIRECLWNDPPFDDVKKTLEDLERVRSIANRICDAIPTSFKVKKPVSELVVGEDGGVSIRCFDPEKAYCEESSEAPEEREATSRDVQEESPEKSDYERWIYVKTPGGREKEKLDAMKAIYDLLDAFFLLKFKLEKRSELFDAKAFRDRILAVKRTTAELIGAAIGEESE